MNQLARFARLFLFAAAPALATVIAGGNPITVAGVTFIAVPAAETAWRQLHPTVPASSATSPAAKP